MIELDVESENQRQALFKQAEDVYKKIEQLKMVKRAIYEEIWKLEKR